MNHQIKSISLLIYLIAVLLFSSVDVYCQYSIENIKPKQFDSLKNPPKHSPFTSILIYDDKILAGTESNGLVLRNSEGEWGFIRPAIRIYCLTVNPVDRKILVGTEKGIYACNSYDISFDYSINHIANSPEIATYSLTSILLKDSSRHWLAGTENGIYFQVNETKWINVYNDRTNCIIAIPNNSGDVFAITNRNVIRGTHFGTKWDVIPCEWLNNNENPSYITSAIIDNKINIFLGTNRGKLLKSEDFGASWSILAEVKDKINCIAAKSNLLFISSESGIYKNMGVELSFPLLSDSMFYSVMIGTNEGDGNLSVFAAGDKGIYKSKAPWDKLELIKSTSIDINTIIFDSLYKEIYLGTNIGIFKSGNFGDSWSKEMLYRENGKELKKTQCTSLVLEALEPKNPGKRHFFAGTHGDGILMKRLDENGTNWSTVMSSITLNEVTSMVIHPDPNMQTIFIGSDRGIYRSHLEPPLDPVPMKVGDLSSKASINSLGVFVDKENSYLLAGAEIMNLENGEIEVDEEGIYKCNLLKNDLIWNSVSKKYRINSILVFPRDGKQVYAGTSKGLIISNDSGDNWKQNKCELDKKEIYSLAYQPDLDVLFAGTGQGVFQSWNNGRNWEKIIISPDLKVSWALAVINYNSEKYLFAGLKNKYPENEDNIYCYHIPDRPEPWWAIILSLILVIAIIIISVILIEKSNLKDRQKNIILALIALILIGIWVLILYEIFGFDKMFAIVSLIGAVASIVALILTTIIISRKNQEVNREIPGCRT